LSIKLGTIITKSIVLNGNDLARVLDGYATTINATTSTGSTGDGYVAFFTGTNKIASDNDLYWDRANNRLGIHNQSPIEFLDVGGNINTSGRIYNSAAALNLGTTATTSHSLVTGDVIIGGALEVDDPDTENTGVGAIDYADMGAYELQIIVTSTTNSLLFAFNE
jgi:hypothetical protein